MVGPLYGPDKLAAIRDALCFCLPSHQEGFSLAIIEALASGVPAIISEGCHFPEVSQSGAGEVLPRNPASFGKAMSRIAGDPDLRQRMSTNARELVQTHYTWPNIAQQTVQMYQRSLQRQPI
jgi:glycosyltransferase involved in cell wall biosynthesis